MKIYSILFTLIILLSTFAYAAGSSTGNTDSTLILSSEEKIFNINPTKVDCIILVPSKCLVVNGELFYDGIIDFNFEEGYNYIIKVEKNQIYTPENAPADSSIYEYKLIEVISKSESEKIDCESLKPDNRKERIKCRFENKARLKTSEYDRVPEACRLNSERKEKCKQLYQKSASCYNKNTAREKKACFLKESGVNQGQLIRNTNKETKRNYLVLLLYELQERIEDWEEDGSISSEDASTLIESIVEIKQDILNGETKQTIKPKIREFRKQFNDLKPLN